MLTDCTNYGTEYANTTNDLYLYLTLGEPIVDNTALDNLSEENNYDDAWYDMLGRRYVDQPTFKGVFIHKGKKIIL